ncbi:MAG: ABC transporter permease [Alphaproteobacteria bacterium]
MSAARAMPRWVDIGLVPLLSVVIAFLISGVIVLVIGQNPLEAVEYLVVGAIGDGYNLGFTLFYTTNFIFAGLAVAVAFHCGLFNIGGEGQAYVAGLGVALVCLHMEGLPFVLILPAAIVAAALFGAGWAFLPALFQAKRGSHIVITTIMFNFIAWSLMNYLLVNVFREPGKMSPETRAFAPEARMPKLSELPGELGALFKNTPVNMAIVWAVVCCVLVYLFVWHTRWGYRLRAVGANETAAVYGGISRTKVIITAMLISGALAGFIALNEVMGASGRLINDYVNGAGFVGIAVALMGRNHPVGIVLAALLFGALYQGGTELQFEMPDISREMVIAIQGLVIMFAGAMDNMVRQPIVALFRRRLADDEDAR